MHELDAGTTASADISGDYTVDAAHSRFGFSVRHAMVTRVRGRFSAFSGTAHVDVARPERSRVDLTIDATSVDTGSPDRDGHLRTHDFFGVAAHPTLTFSSTEVTRTVTRTGTAWTITGGLTMKGVTRSVDLVLEEVGSARDPWGHLRVGFEGQATINRSDWGLNFNAALETGGVLVSEKVTLELDVSAVRDPD